MKCLSTLALAISFSTASAMLRADVKLPGIFSDNMVLQRDLPVAIWGTAAPGEEVRVSASQTSASGKADANGAWQVKLPALEAGGGPIEVVVVGANTITLKNVLVGDVWVCSGQSNMEWSVSNSDNPDAEIAAATHPQIRLFTVERSVAEKPMSDCKGKWAETSPQSIRAFSAVGFYFGRQLHKDLNVPIGLINASVGGTPAESWTSRQGLEADASLHYLNAMADQAIAAYPAQLKAYEEALAGWQKEFDETKAQEDALRAEVESGKITEAAPEEPVELDDKPKAAPAKPRRTTKEITAAKPRPPASPVHDTWRPSGLYNAMIAPIVPLGIKGAIWYQGESNAGRAQEYLGLMTALINDWRKAWGQGDFTFLIVQLANFTEAKDQPVESDWAELREAQFLTTQAIPNVGIATAIDVGDAADIHPRNKQEVGRRLALQAEKMAYGMKDVVASGPTYTSHKAEGDAIRLTFTDVGKGLVAKDGAALSGFQIAGADHKWVWGDATIDGQTVVVKSTSISTPVAVRYGWANNPPSTLYNQAGLPALPFRTDDWKGITDGKKR